ncbi:MAG: autoinducer binding domain-containing protein [Rubrimonas sp.]|uniref:helix-turn-helix transcriptional regulator n=1 Tax=Rubrimonas sp. TaxID=2036015 RepID=UPI002FDE9C7B
MRRVLPVADAILAAETPEAIGEALGGLRDAWGVDQATFIMRAPDRADVAPAAGTLPGAAGMWLRRRGWFSIACVEPEWVRRYEELSFQNVDPVVLTASRRFSAFDWRELDFSAPRSAALRAEASAYGVGLHGLTVPLHGAPSCEAAFSVISTGGPAAWDAVVAEGLGDFLTIAAALQQRAHALLGLATAPRRAPDLDHVERRALAGIASGRGVAEIAGELRLTCAQLRRRLATARAKLGAETLAQAVARALRLGVLHPHPDELRYGGARPVRDGATRSASS